MKVYSYVRLMLRACTPHGRTMSANNVGRHFGVILSANIVNSNDGPVWRQGVNRVGATKCVTTLVDLLPYQIIQNPY